VRYTEAVQPLQTGGMMETKTFTIAATGKAFKNLMDGLYSRKIEAFCREILTNAYDSHVAAGTPERLFDVWVPTIFDKRLKVRDYGVGMDHEQVMTRYSTLFDSTKDQSDEFVGMLGLGSKSPFAYTDGFSLRCWDGQECRVYSAYLGEGGVPQISLASRVPSDEPRGVEVGIPVAREDFEEVSRCLARVAVGFAHPPKLSTDIQEQMKFDYSAYGTDWALGECKILGKGVFARQGCVLYPVDYYTALKCYPDWEDITLTLVLDFNLGDLEVTPSRETLSMTDKTKASLRKSFERVMTEIGESLEDQFQDCRTDWETATKFSQLNINRIPKKLLKKTSYMETYNRVAQTLREIMYQGRGSKREYRFALIELGYQHRSGGRVYTLPVINKTYTVTNGSDSYRTPKFRFPKEENEKPFIFVVDDGMSNAKIAHWMLKNGHERALVLRKSVLKSKSQIYEHRVEAQGPWREYYNEKPTAVTWSKPFGQLTEEDMLKFHIVEELGHPYFHRASGFMDPPKEPKAPPAPREEGLLYMPSTGQWKSVDRKELNALRSTHKFLFYSKQRRAILKPRGDVPAAEWEVAFNMESALQGVMQNLKAINGHAPKLALIRVVPKSWYKDYRTFPLLESVEEALLNSLTQEKWDKLVPQILWDNSGFKSTITPNLDLGAVLSKAVNPNVRRLGRIITAISEPMTVRKLRIGRSRAKVVRAVTRTVRDENESFYEHIRKSLLTNLLSTSEAVWRQFVDECKKRDYRVHWDGWQVEGGRSWRRFDSQSWISPSWVEFINRFQEVMSYTADREELELYFQGMELAELTIQSRGGRRVQD
jgi:hypothetical protein